MLRDLTFEQWSDWMEFHTPEAPEMGQNVSEWTEAQKRQAHEALKKRKAEWLEKYGG